MLTALEKAAKELKMKGPKKLYYITFERTETAMFRVSAPTQELAESLAWDQVNEGNGDWNGGDTNIIDASESDEQPEDDEDEN